MKFWFEVAALVALASSGTITALNCSAQTPPSGTSENLIYSIKGSDLFHTYCAACHGPAGKGNGPMASSLRVKPADLTLLAKKNQGRFPAMRVRSLIAGDEDVASHGPREMPLWGPIFHQIEYDQDLGKVRLENLVKYVESIQQK
jgi:mono/diheme cytochrome c family protein